MKPPDKNCVFMCVCVYVCVCTCVCVHVYVCEDGTFIISVYIGASRGSLL